MCLFNIPSNCSICQEFIRGKVPQTAYWLNGIWICTCPIVLLGAVAIIGNRKGNVHSWIMASYLVTKAVVNVNSVLVVLNTGKPGCGPTDFGIKFFYLSTLCWLTSLNFLMWKAFRKMASRKRECSLKDFYISMGFTTAFPAAVVTISFYAGTLHGGPQDTEDHDACENHYCILYAPNGGGTFYNPPVIFLILLNTALFSLTWITIFKMKRRVDTALQRDDPTLVSFRIFTKLFLMTGPIWVLRLGLLFLQFQGLYLMWYGIVLEVLFMAPEVTFSIGAVCEWNWVKQKLGIEDKNVLHCQSVRATESSCTITSK